MSEAQTDRLIDPENDDFDDDIALGGAVLLARGRWQWLRRLLLATVAAIVVAVTVIALTTRHVPDFYRQRLAAGELAGAAAEQAGRRVVSDVSALHAAFIREGRWEAAFTEADINAWLATDLPRNHTRLLPTMVSAPRVRLAPQQVQIGLRLGSGIVSAVSWLVLEIRLREPNQLGIVVVEARLGGLPLPHGPIQREIRRRFDQLGMVTTMRRLDDRNVLVVYIPSTHESGGMSHWLESLSIGEGSIAFAGHTISGREHR
ncbi:MAG: hypothetical protein ACR2IT_04395 [Pirellulales bacterium]